MLYRISTNSRALLIMLSVLPAIAAAGNGAPVIEPASEQVLQRLDRIERMLDNQNLLELFNRVEALQSQVQKLRGELESQQHQIEQMTRRQKDLYADIDNRLQKLESGSAGTDQNAGTDDVVNSDFGVEDTLGSETGNDNAATEEEPVVADSETIASNSDARAAYNKAFDQLKAGEYEQAIAAFKEYLQNYLDSEYADNARYWLGEAYYVTGDFEQAIDAYQQLLDDDPQSQKAPHALLKIGYSQQKLGNNEQARKTLEDLRSRYPNTTAASLAQERLQQL